MKKKLFILIAALIAISASAQTKRALVIGISDYPKCGAGSWEAIHGANDAELIVPILQGQGFKTTKICNEAATAEKIRKALNALVKSCTVGDIVYIHFSCHGQPFEDMNGDEGEKDGWDESIVPYDAQKVYKKGVYEGQNHITDDELHTYYQMIRKKIGKSGFVCIVDDACNAGGSSRGEDKFVRGTKKGFSPNEKDFDSKANKKGRFLIPQEPSSADITILEACRHYQSNHEIKQSDEYYGPLSYYVSQVLKKKELTNSLDWVIDVKRLMDGNLVRQNMVYETSLK